MAYAALSSIQTIAAGQVFTAATLQQANDNDEFLARPPVCSVSHSVAVSLTNNTLTKMAADTEAYDSDSMHSTVTNNTRITIQTAGRYLFLACVVFNPSATGERLVDFLVNNTTQYVGLAYAPNPTSAANTNVTVLRTMVLAASDYVEVRARQQTGGALNAQLYEFAGLLMTLA